MGYFILKDSEDNQFCFACNTTDVAFGPIMYVPDGEDVDEVADEFVKWLKKDPRSIDPEDIRTKWLKYSDARWGE